MAVSEGVGYVACLVAVLFFGTNFIPVKKFDAGDGLYFQWFMCLGILLVGVIVQCARDFPEFHPLAMWGGAMWCTGNIMAVPTIQCIGLSLGLLLWGGSNMLVGWATGRFGLFGLEADEISNGDLNYVGVALALLAFGMFALIEPVESSPPTPPKSGLLGDAFDDAKRDSTFGLKGEPLLPTSDSSSSSSSPSSAPPPVSTWVTSLSPSSRRLIGLLMSLIMGVFFGSSFTPANLAMNASHSDDDGENKPDPLDYVFSHLVGIFVASSLYFALYVALKGGWTKVQKLPAIRIPAIISGVMWCVAQVSWFVANGALGFSVAFPMITSGPGLVAALIGVVFFGEIKGRKNFFVLGAAFCTTCVANALIVMSR